MLRDFGANCNNRDVTLIYHWKYEQSPEIS
jgi:hypothetical protein